MSFISLDQISYRDGPQLDGYGKLRIAAPVKIFDSQFQYEVGLTDWTTVTSGTGSVSHVANQSAAQLSTGGTASGAYCYRSTRLCWQVQPGDTQIMRQAFAFGVAITNVRRRIGYFNSGDGIFLEQTDAGLYIVLRSSVTGAPVDLRIAQADWNVDGMNSAINPLNPSGITLDAANTQQMVIDIQGMSVGRGRIGFSIDGMDHWAHYFGRANALPTFAIKTTSLPLRVEIENTGVAGSAATLLQGASCVESENGNDAGARGSLRTASNGTSRKTVAGTLVPILSVRSAATFFGQPNRAWYILLEAILLASKDLYFEVRFNPTLSGPTAWTAADPFSTVEYDVGATGITTAGTKVVSGYVSAAGSGSNTTGVQVASTAGRFPNSVDDLTGAQPHHTLLAASVDGTNASVGATINWRELF